MLEHLELVCLRNKTQIQKTISARHQRLVSAPNKNKLHGAGIFRSVFKKPFAENVNILAALFAPCINKVSLRKRQRFLLPVAGRKLNSNASDHALYNAAANATPIIFYRQLFFFDRVEENVL